MTTKHRQVVVADSGSGNLRSVAQALAAAGGEPLITADPDRVAGAERLVVPGQGAFGACVAALDDKGAALRQAVGRFIASGRPYFGICLGLQILFGESEESPGVRGLDLIPGRVVRFSPEMARAKGLKIPHMGWNETRQTASGRVHPLLDGTPDGTHFYFVHSYYAAPQRPEDTVLESDHGVPFAAALARDNLFACQFHPEKSQGAGLGLLRRFLAL